MLKLIKLVLLPSIIIIALLALCVVVYFNEYMDYSSDLGKKNVEAQKKELLTNEKYKDLPEVAALREQLKQQDELKPASEHGNNESNNSNKKTSDTHATDADKGVFNKEIKTNTNATRYKDSEENIPSQAEIEQELINALISLRNEYNAQLNNLITLAAAEYEQIPSEQKGKKAMLELAKKYLELAKGLEAECDARVYALIIMAENELAKYGYASDVPQKAREEYEKQKEELRQELLDTVLSKIK